MSGRYTDEKDSVVAPPFQAGHRLKPNVPPPFQAGPRLESRCYIHVAPPYQAGHRLKAGGTITAFPCPWIFDRGVVTASRRGRPSLRGSPRDRPIRFCDISRVSDVAADAAQIKRGGRRNRGFPRRLGHPTATGHGRDPAESQNTKRPRSQFPFGSLSSEIPFRDGQASNHVATFLGQTSEIRDRVNCHLALGHLAF